MTRVQTLESNAYDVLGVSPNASAQAIDDAFRRLIDGGGYRIGVPLRGQWLRAHQIKEAYATLGDPIKRSAYDESLKGASGRPLWPAASGNDPSLTALLRPFGEEQVPPEPTFRAGAGAIGSGNDEIDPYVDQEATSARDGELEQVATGAIEPETEQIVPDVDQPATWEGEDSSRDGANYGSARLWGSAAAAALVLGSLVYFSWPGGTPPRPDTETAALLPPWVQQLNSGAPRQLAKLPPAAEADGTFGKAREGSDTASATETAVPGTAPSADVVANETQTDAEAGVAAGGQTASATAPVPAPPISGQGPSAVEAAAAPAPVPPSVQAPAPVPPSVQAPSAAPPPVAARSGAGEVRSPAQLIGGGPTHSDNPRGRHVGSVVVQFTVQADGRVSNCGTVRSSGKASLDSLTCRLVEERMRFKPALDGQGNPVASTAHARYEWGRRRRHGSLFSSIFR